MDITSRYRTKYPPKEHEEAVRMLLENIAAKQAPQEEIIVRESATNNRYDYDGRSLISNDSRGSSERAHATQNNNVTSISSATNTAHQHCNKATSTGDSVSLASSSSGVEQEGASSAYREPIPSRTIAVQCDLKASSLKHDHLFDRSMQASSISSTRYGFYNFTPETLANRRKIERSISHRDITHLAGSNGAGLPKGTSIPSKLGAQIEAPTSMSELSSSLSASDNELDNSTRSSRPVAYVDGRLPVDRLNGESSRRRLLNANGDYRRGYGNKAPLYGSMLDNSVTGQRESTLPRRPVTALSYVSSNRLRGQEHSTSGECSSDQESELAHSRGSQLIKSRAMSQQTLARMRTPAPGELLEAATSSSSSSDLGNISTKTPANRSSGDQSSINYQVDRSTDEIVITKRGESATPIKPPRPTLVSSAHNELVRDYRSLARSGSPARGGIDEQPVRDSAQASRRAILRSANRLLESSTTDKKAGAPQMLGSFRDNGEQPPSDRTGTSSRSMRDHSNRVYDENYNSYDECAANYYKPAVAQKPDRADSGGERYFVSEDEQRQASRFAARYTPGRINSSMSLSRPRTQVAPLQQQQQASLTTGGYHTSRKPNTSQTLNGRAGSQTLLSEGPIYAPNRDLNRRQSHTLNSNGNEVFRTTSMRHIERPSARYDQAKQYPVADHLAASENRRQDVYEREQADLDKSERTSAYKDYDDSRTWANPSCKLNGQTNGACATPKSHRRCSRSRSMRNVYDGQNFNDNNNGQTTTTNTEFYPLQQNNNFQQYHSSSESSAVDNAVPQFIKAQPLDYDSQHRLNESGLPDVDSMTMQARKLSAPSSYLGTASGGHHQMLPSYTLGRSSQIRGRAMSQQSLTRPSMPLASRRRRTATGGSNSGSDVGGSSMSLVSRLNGRYENARTRNPIVMYIPQATQRFNQTDENKNNLDTNKSSTLRKSSRSRIKSSSQDRSKRSLSRNGGSDSESSSMLRTLLRPKSRHQVNNASKRRMHNLVLDHQRDDEEEDLDRIGHLATELDTYKFRRRYSVPKDAKINWFAKLKQKVSSGGGR